MIKISRKGKVVFAGAGPGDPELLTIKTVKYLQIADVILIDRLVSPDIISLYASKDAEVLYVGKQCSRGIHTPQEEINSLISHFALQDKLVVRLKGGDATLFSNILDELQEVKKYGIPYEIIPGVSAAFGAAAYAGIPLTARDHSRGVRFLTLYDLAHTSTIQWLDWAQTDDTLVYYMSGQKIQVLVQNLIENGIDHNKSIAIVQQATTPEQKTNVFSFKNIVDKPLPEFDFVPTLIMVGRVVNLHADFAWFTEKKQPESYFDNHKNRLKNVI
jgi:uroporphyrin-III C-methyltransferase/precorrin-2 dehydrogenase/sirohydrochlorin ferrochelatase/uroporphyrin-III C-methyltransferase